MIQQILILFIPPAIANIVPPLVSKLLPHFNQPMDFNLSLRGRRILGDHKTIRGLLSGILFAQLSFSLLITVLPQSNDWNLPTYFGSLLGLFALLGDAVKSFIKRQLDITPGETWFPFDQIDWVLGVILLCTLYLPINSQLANLSAILISAGFIGHLIAKYIGYLMKINDKMI